MTGAPKVGIMLRHVTAPGGVTVFTRRVVRWLLTHPRGVEYHLLYSDASQREVFADLPGKHLVLEDKARLRWDQVTAPRYAEEHGLSLLFNCKFSVPLAAKVPTLIVIPGREQLAMDQVIGIMLLIVGIGLAVDRTLFLPWERFMHKRWGLTG